MSQNFQFNIGSVGRIISGSVSQKRTKNMSGHPIPEDDQKYEFGVAWPKGDQHFDQFLSQLWQFVSANWANDQSKLAALQTAWGKGFQGLSLKINDGDKPNSKGQINENTKGHWVVWFSSSFDVPCCNPGFQQIDPETVKTGYYVMMSGSMKDNGQALPHAGVYMNASHVMLVAEGEVIQGGIDAETAFNGVVVPTNLPSGARPLGTQMGMQPPGAPVPQPPGAGQSVPVPPQMAPADPPQPPGTPQLPTVPQQGNAYPSDPPQQPAPHTQILNPPPPPPQ